MREIGLSDWHSFNDEVQSMMPSTSNDVTYMFRGQINASWELSCSLHRAIQNPTYVAAIAAERYALHHFKANAYRFSRSEDLPPHLPEQPVTEWWSLMQHHGVPTRLLDLTTSPYVAAYFACEADWENDAGIYFMHRGPIQQSPTQHLPIPSPGDVAYEEAINLIGAPHTIRTYFPKRMTDRLAAQQGMFLYSDNVMASLQDDLDALYVPIMKENPLLPLFGKFIIRKELKKDFMVKLRTMNVTAQTLFPGVDGLGRYVAEGIRTGLGA